MKGIYFFITLFLGCCVSAQVLERYPEGQEDYVGGNVQLYQDLHNIFVKSGLKPCEDKNELYLVEYVVYPDVTIKFIKNEAEDATKNQCAKQLAAESFKYLKRWNPAVLNGVKVPAVGSIYIYPDDLFEKFKTDYDLDNYSSKPTFGGGINAFRQLFFRQFSLPSRENIFPGPYILQFTVNTEGKLENIGLIQSSGNKAMDEELIKAAQKVRGKWIPGKIHGIPVNTEFRMPISIRVQ